MEIRPIRSEADYDAALVDIEQYFDREPTPGTPEADRFDVLATLIGAYEDKHHAIAAPDAVTAIAEVMALRGHKQADLGRLLGSKSRASEIMNRKRRLTLEQAKKLHGAWGVPAASLLGDVGDLDAVGTQQKTRDAPRESAPPRSKARGWHVDTIVLVASVLKEKPAGQTASEIRTVLQSEGVSMPVRSIDRALKQLAKRKQAAAAGDGKTWSYVGGSA